MSIIIYAKRDDDYLNWKNLNTTGFDRLGNHFVDVELNGRSDIVVLVVPDNEVPPERFLPPEHLFTHIRGPDDQKERARFVGDADGFSHIPDTPIYEALKTLLSEDDLDRKAGIIRNLYDKVGVDKKFSALLGLCMIEQIKMLSPGGHQEDLDEAIEYIGVSQFGNALLEENIRRTGTQEAFGTFLDRKLNEIKPPA